jgi:hypothetical protein
MQQLLGLLVIRVDPAGATVALDGEALGAGPFDAPVPVDVGRHVVEASLAGYEPSRQDVTVGTLQTVEVVLGLRPVVEPPSAAVPPAEEGRKINQAWFWTTAGTAVASGVAAAVTGGLTYAAFQDFAAGGHVDRGLADEGEALETTTNVLAGVAGAAAAAALVLAFFTDFGAGEEPPAAAPASALVWPGGLAVVW